MQFADIWLKNHNAIRVQYIKRDIVRIRYNASGVFKLSLTERYGLVNTEFVNDGVRMEESGDAVRIFSGDLVVNIMLEDGAFSLAKKAGGIVLERVVPIAPQKEMGSGGVFRIDDCERFYGGGYRAMDAIERRGQVIRNWCTNVVNYGPSPFIMSSREWGVFWNITHGNYFDLGCRKKDEMVLWSEDGEVDIFLFTGDFQHILDGYTDITGKPMLLPLFGYGLTSICNEGNNQFGILDIAERYRREGIPCDTLSLEPDWMSKRYDMSLNQDWDQGKYYVCDWMPPERTFIYALKEKGFKLSLWTPINYDLTFEAERQYERKHPWDGKKPLYHEDGKNVGDFDDAFIDAQIKSDTRMDNITVPEEPWFKHFIKFFDKGVRGLKEDGCTHVSQHSDRFYKNGKGDGEMHNLNQSIIAMQYNQGYREYADKRPTIFTPSTYIGNQKWSATWAGDVGGSGIALGGLLSYSMQGHMNFACDMDNTKMEGIHFGFFMGWAQLCNWANMTEPWHMRKELKDAFIYYDRLRYSLLPYIYSSAYQGYCTGLAICRAMVLMYPSDDRTYNMKNEYMFGDWLLIGVFSDSVYLPEGKWIDYWTGIEYSGRQDIACGYPEGRGGYLFIKKGAIIPCWPEVNYVGEKEIETLTIKIYPYGKSSFTIYEDDGESYDYERGIHALTKIMCIEKDGNINITIGKRNGSYVGIPEKRKYIIEIYGAKVETVVLNSAIAAWEYDTSKGTIIVNAVEGEEDNILINAYS